MGKRLEAFWQRQRWPPYCPCNNHRVIRSYPVKVWSPVICYDHIAPISYFCLWTVFNPSRSSLSRTAQYSVNKDLELEWIFLAHLRVQEWAQRGWGSQASSGKCRLPCIQVQQTCARRDSERSPSWLTRGTLFTLRFLFWQERNVARRLNDILIVSQLHV